MHFRSVWDHAELCFNASEDSMSEDLQGLALALRQGYKVFSISIMMFEM